MISIPFKSEYLLISDVQGMIVKAATSYTSYKELWQDALKLENVSSHSMVSNLEGAMVKKIGPLIIFSPPILQVEPGPMVVMQAAMVQLPFAASIGESSLLLRLVESDVAVNAYGCETLNAVITFKWRKFAMREIYTKTIIFMTFLVTYTVYAIVLRLGCSISVLCTSLCRFLCLAKLVFIHYSLVLWWFH